MYANRKENKTISKATCEKIRKIISGILEDAFRNELIASNPIRRIKITYDDELDTRMHYYDIYTYKKVLELIQKEKLEYHTIIELALKSGMRRSEIFALQYDDIDFNKGSIRINKSRHYIAHKGMETSKTKTKSSNRTIIVPQSTIDLLKAYKKAHPNNEYLFDGISIDGICSWFQKFQIRNGIKPIRFHDLRHTHATLLLSQNVDLKTISHRLGHSSIDMTMDIYTHVLDELDASASNKIENI